MSYDMEVFLVDEPKPVEGPAGKDWQVSVEEALVVESEDVPESVSSALPGIRYLVNIHVEGNVPKKALKAAEVLARKLARKHRGVVVDQQIGSIETPRGVKRYVPSPGSEESEIALSWFFLDDKRFQDSGLDEFVSLLAQRMPEALARRYGLWEPPQHKLENEGLEHFRGFLKENLRDLVVWYCSRPFSYVFLSIPQQVGPSRDGFRCCRVSVRFAASVLQVPGWPLELRRLWLDMAGIVHPFYADVRKRDGTGTKGPWWNGIPRETPLATLLGAPYLELWPEFSTKASTAGDNMLYMDTGLVPGEDEVSFPPPPLEISQPPQKPSFDPFSGEVLPKFMWTDLSYPERWPFDGPVSSEGKP